MEAAKIIDYIAVKDWLQAISNRSDGSKDQYLRWFSKFCDFLQMNPDQVLALREKEMESGDRGVKHAMERRLLSFIAHLKGRLHRQ